MINIIEMFNIRGCFKNRTIGFYLSFASAVLSLVIAVVYAIAAGADRIFNLTGMILIVVGALSWLLVLFTDFKFAPMVPTIIIAIGGSISFIDCLYPMLDVLNGINFFGGNLTIAMFVTFGLLVTILMGCVASFMSMRKAEDTAEKE